MPYKAHLFSNQDWFDLLDAIDDALEKTYPTLRDKDAACSEARTLLNKLSRLAWQCTVCGKIYVENDQRALQQFAPVTEPGDLRLFSSKSHKEDSGPMEPSP